MTAVEAVVAILAVVGAAGLGFASGVRRERRLTRVDAAMLRWLAAGLRVGGPVHRDGAMGGTPSGAPNQLHRLRQRLGVTTRELARRLGISVADAHTLEHTPFDLLEFGDVERVANALGTRLDVVAVHRLDGIAHWLSDDHLSERLRPRGRAS